jgi:signal peptidase II
VRKGLFAAVVSSSVVLLDYITKKTIETYVQPHEVINVLPFLRIVNIKNTGAAFGILSDLSNNIFIFVSIAAIIFIVIYMLRTFKRLEIFSLSLILGGAIGNLIDRVTIGKVIDFIDFSVGEWHWPAFNVADSSLSIGIILFLLASIKQRKHTD